MDIVTILRELQGRRRSVLVVLLVAIVAAIAVTHKLPGFQSRSHDVGIASAQILLDTPSSQIADVAPRGADSLGLRANLLASLMVAGAVEDEIARKAGLPASQLGSTTDATIDATPGAALDASPSSGSHPYLLTTHIMSDATDDPLPIIEVDTQAPTSAGAVRLAQASVDGLRGYLESTAAAESIPDAQRLQVTGLGVTQGATETRGPTVLVGGLVLVLVLVLGCAGILIGSVLRRRWRAAEHEQFEGERRLPPVQEPVALPYGHQTLALPYGEQPVAPPHGSHTPSPVGSRLVRREQRIELADSVPPRDPDMQPVGEPGDSEHRDMRRTGAASKLSRVSRFVR